jgi:hypothetical protein
MSRGRIVLEEGRKGKSVLVVVAFAFVMHSAQELPA